MTEWQKQTREKLRAGLRQDEKTNADRTEQEGTGQRAEAG